MESALPAKGLPTWVWPLVKWVTFAAVLVFVGHRAWELWRTTPPEAWDVDWVWLLPAAICYVLGWVPAVWFWRRMLASFGPKPRWLPALQAYFMGHLGKYLPGKGMVLVIRAALVREDGVNPGVGAITAGYETLATMGAGAALAVALAPLATSKSLWNALPEWLQPLHQQAILLPILVVLVTLVSLPINAQIFTFLAGKMAPPSRERTTKFGITSAMLFQGLLSVSLGWLMFGLSLGCVLKGLGATHFSLSEVPVWVAAVTLSTVGGFVVVVAPGGLGVREMLLAEVLLSQSGLTEVQAFLAAWLLRAVWLVSEAAVAGILTLVRRPSAIKVTESDVAITQVAA